MTGSNDLDRLLGAYLDEGPRRAPDRAVDAAIAFARAHPRRRDPLGFLKPDVMARRSAIVSSQLAWAALVAVLTVGMVVAIGVGSRPNPAPVVPPPSIVASPSRTAPSSSPPPATPVPSNLILELTDGVGAPGASGDTGVTFDRLLEVRDQSGTIVAVKNGPSPVDEPVTELIATRDPEDPSRVVLRWPFKPCDEKLLLTVDPAADSFVLERKGCVIGDTIGGADHQVVLTFSRAVEPTTFDLELVETP